jgi:hypothetical protein
MGEAVSEMELLLLILLSFVLGVYVGAHMPHWFHMPRRHH